MSQSPDRKPDLRSVTENMRRAAAAFKRVGEAAARAGRTQDSYTIADHPDLDALNLELNNLYGNSFE